MKNSSAKLSLLTLLLSIASAGAAHGQAVVWSFSGNWVTANQQLGRTGSGAVNGSNYIYSLAFNDTTALSPASNYTPPAGSVGTFYGGYKFNVATTTAYTPTAVVEQNATNDRINFALGSLGTLNSEINAFIYWKKADFLNGYSSQNIALTSSATGSLQVAYGAGASTQTRFVINSGGTYYISQTAQTNNTSSLYTLAFDPTTNWAVYDPFSDVELGTVTYSVASSALNDIQGVGVYMERVRTNTSHNIALHSFQFDPSPVPEPSTAAAVAGLGAAFFAVARRRRGQIRAAA